MIYRLFHIFFGLSFLSSAFLQINDPDPFFWITIYGLAAFSSLLALRPNNTFGFHLLLSIFTFIYGIFLLVDGSDFFSSPANHEMLGIKEQGREALGLLIIFFVNLITCQKKYFAAKNESQDKEKIVE